MVCEQNVCGRYTFKDEMYWVRRNFLRPSSSSFFINKVIDTEITEDAMK